MPTPYGNVCPLHDAGSLRWNRRHAIPARAVDYGAGRMTCSAVGLSCCVIRLAGRMACNGSRIVHLARLVRLARVGRAVRVKVVQVKVARVTGCRCDRTSRCSSVVCNWLADRPHWSAVWSFASVRAPSSRSATPRVPRRGATPRVLRRGWCAAHTGKYLYGFGRGGLQVIQVLGSRSTLIHPQCQRRTAAPRVLHIVQSDADGGQKSDVGKN